MTIKEARLNAGLSQEKTARLLDISLRYYQTLEQMKSEPNVRLAIRLCHLLNLDIYDIYS